MTFQCVPSSAQLQQGSAVLLTAEQSGPGAASVGPIVGGAVVSFWPWHTTAVKLATRGVKGAQVSMTLLFPRACVRRYGAHVALDLAFRIP
eukprot:CAMPEP_0206593276 /NCGR_PEP_ID=MMETSP0325_2-20121206/41553_1 /ASSEMBLY_ACC=CAM_ASM_000347 /TAXON_ID=2866 /ORGANISM="Crypthecodinium cohnii, Strain Seligo" /LENGTH=90 /DNA_ID=CAMNT_0054103257 /DNA_START=284 /DNA_END=557 /DNA_ORIENTATION=-